MGSTPPAIQNLARRLLALESARASSPVAATAAVQACERLRHPLAKLAGVAGFSSLLSRALTLAKREAPSLEGLRVEANGSLSTANNDQQDAREADAARQAEVILLAELLNLLVTLIGERLTLGLIRELWPDASMDGAPLSSEVKP